MPTASAPRAGRSPAPSATPSAGEAGEHRARSSSERPEASAALGLSAEELDVLLRVGELLRSIRHGNVVIVVQDGRVMQIETAEKFRLR
jgi:hypothetical protein